MSDTIGYTTSGSMTVRILNESYIRSNSSSFTLMSAGRFKGLSNLESLGTICNTLYNCEIYQCDASALTVAELSKGVYINDDGKVGINQHGVNYVGTANGISFSIPMVYNNYGVTTGGTVSAVNMNKRMFAVVDKDKSVSTYSPKIIVPIFYEQAQEFKFYNFGEATIGNPVPYQPMEEVISGTASLFNYKLSTSSLTLVASTTYSGSSGVLKALTACYGMKTYYTDANSSVSLSIISDNVCSSSSTLTVNVGTWDSEEYSVVSTGSTYKIYFGQEVDTDSVFKAFKVTLTKQNSYKTLTETIYTQLDSKIAYITSSQSGKTLNLTAELTVDFTGFNYTAKLSNIYGVSSIQRVDTLKYGDVFTSIADDLSRGQFVYTDGTTLNLSKIPDGMMSFTLSSTSNIKTGDTITSSIGDNVYEQLLIEYKYNVTANVYTAVQKNIELATHVSVTNFVSNWKWGDKMSMTGTLNFLDDNEYAMEKLDLSTADVSLYTTDFPINQVLGEETAIEATKFDITFHYNDRDFTTQIPVTLRYPLSLNFKNINTAKTQFIEDNAEPVVDMDYEIAYFDDGNTSKIDVTDVTVSHGAINYSEKSNVAINFTTTYEGRTLTATYAVMLIPVEMTGISCDSSITAYDSSITTFDPSGFTFKRVYNSGKEDTEGVELSTISFYYDEACTNALTSGSKIKYQTSNKIYFKSTEYPTFVGAISVDWVHDSIQSIEIVSSSFVLGNKPSKDYLTLKATYLSGEIDNNFSDYEFVDLASEVISSQSISITADNKTFSVTPTFVNPTFKSASILLNNAKTAYQNNSVIDFSNTQMQITYSDATYVSVVDFGTKMSASTSDSTYTFDGTSELEVDMGGETSKTLVITFTATDPITSDKRTTTETISIYEISSIVGIKITKATTEYKLNSYFLNEEDETTAMVYYKDSNGNTGSKSIKLNSGFPYINTSIAKGEKLTKEGSFTVNVTAYDNSTINASYTIYVSSSIQYDDNTETVYLVVVPQWDLINHVDVYYLYEETSSNQVTYVENGVRKLKAGTGATPVGYLKNVNDFNRNGVVVLYKDYIAPNDSDSNMIVKFPCYVEGYADQINKCTFGILFGNNNAKNRLFVSGNSDMCNYDWHSGETETVGDFSYFSDLSYCAYGQTSNSVVGYDIVSDGKLAVFKSKSALEPTIYYRTSSYVQAIDSTGNALTGIDGESLYQEEYPLTTGNIGFGAISHECVTNFNGDTMFLSSGYELDGLDVVGEIGNSQRHANTRSAYIDPKIREKNLSKAILWTDNTTLYLAFDDELYQCDYRSQADESTQYEWFRSDIKGIKSMCLLDDNKYFGTSDGRLCKLEGDDYYDIDKIFVSYGGGYLASVDPSDTGVTPNTMYVNSSYISDLVGKTGCKVRLYKSGDTTQVPYAQLCTIGNLENVYDLYIDKNSLGNYVLKIDGKGNLATQKKLEKLIQENVEYYLNPIENDMPYVISSDDTTAFNTDKTYVLQWDFEGFALYEKSNGVLSKCDISKLYRAGLCKKLSGVFPIGEIKEGTLSKTTICYFSILDDDGNPYNLVNKGNTALDSVFPFEIIVPKAVEAYYITSPFVMGNLSYSKTVWSWTITDDTAIKHSLRLGTIYSFDKFSEIGKYLEQNSWVKKTETPIKYTFVKPMRCPFVCFCIKNNEGENAVLSTIQIQYTLSSNAYSKF